MNEQVIEMAIMALTQEIEHTPDNALLYKERGRLRMMMGRKKEAMEDVQKALQLDPQLAESLNGNSKIREKICNSFCVLCDNV